MPPFFFGLSARRASPQIKKNAISSLEDAGWKLGATTANLLLLGLRVGAGFGHDFFYFIRAARKFCGE